MHINNMVYITSTGYCAACARNISTRSFVLPAHLRGGALSFPTGDKFTHLLSSAKSPPIAIVAGFST